MMVEINTFYVTYLNEEAPIMVYQRNDGLQVDLHVQLLNLSREKYPISFSITSNYGEELLSFSGEVDTTKLGKLSDDSLSAIASVAFFIKMTKDELKDSSSLTFEVKIEGESKQLKLFLKSKEEK